MSMSVSQGGGRFRAYLRFLLAVCYFFVARSIAHRGAVAIANESWIPLTEQALLALQLLLGFAAMGLGFDHQTFPIREQGLSRRSGWTGEAGLGLAAGWALAVVCVLPLVLVGGIAITLNLQFSEWGWLLAGAVYFAFATLAEEVAFRGYGFQCFERAVGSSGAALGFALFYAVLQQLQLGSSRTSFLVSLLLGLVLSTAYLRTRALWLSWGLNFAWKACRALLFGLTVSGSSSHSSVVQGDPMGPFWLTGGGYGLDGSWVAILALLAAWVMVYRLTRNLDFQYNAPVLVPGGIPMDVDALARKEHEAAMGPVTPAAQSLVQILPLVQPSSVTTDVAIQPDSQS
jgi:membrane protease YdiL (CAAX protease family)